MCRATPKIRRILEAVLLQILRLTRYPFDLLPLGRHAQDIIMIKKSSASDGAPCIVCVKLRLDRELQAAEMVT